MEDPRNECMRVGKDKSEEKFHKKRTPDSCSTQANGERTPCQEKREWVHVDVHATAYKQHDERYAVLPRASGTMHNLLYRILKRRSLFAGALAVESHSRQDGGGESGGCTVMPKLRGFIDVIDVKRGGRVRVSSRGEASSSYQPVAGYPRQRSFHVRAHF